MTSKRQTLREALIEQNKAESRLKAALEREYPVDSYVHWTHGEHRQQGRVIDHSSYNARVRVINTRTGTVRWLEASEVHYGETGEHL